MRGVYRLAIAHHTELSGMQISSRYFPTNYRGCDVMKDVTMRPTPDLSLVARAPAYTYELNVTLISQKYINTYYYAKKNVVPPFI